MSRNISQAARGVGEVAQNIQGVAQAAESTSHGATDSQKAAKSLAQMSTELRELVGRFKREGRSRRRATERPKPERDASLESQEAAEEQAELAAR